MFIFYGATGETSLPSTRQRPPMATVTAGARLHFGFQNLSLARPRLYGGVGVVLDDPSVTVSAERADEVVATDPEAREYAERAVALLGVPGASVEVLEPVPRHVGLGSGTQLALATLAAVARAHDRTVDVRLLAPDMGRGGRSGVGVAGFQRGGLVVDGGHPTGRFTEARPADGEWTVPPVVARHAVPDDWRFLLVRPDADPGRSGDGEDDAMRRVVETADPAVADEIAALVIQRLLPAIAGGELSAFAAAVAELGRLNGAWYADEQGGVYRPPVGTVVDELSGAPAVEGAGQSSWGPTVYGITDLTRADAARGAAREALAAASVEGAVSVVAASSGGADVER
jgi:beta-ribofuranosylaminobenzene 5'-phosphate synthase